MSDSNFADAGPLAPRQRGAAAAAPGLVDVFARHTVVGTKADGQQFTALPGDACQVPAADLEALLERGAVTLAQVAVVAARVAVTQNDG